MRKAPDGSVTGRPASLSSKNSRSRGSSGQVCELYEYFVVLLSGPNKCNTTTMQLQ